MTDTKLIELTADIVSAHVSNNIVASSEVASLIRSVFDALAKTAEPLVADAPRQDPAVSVRSSIRPDYLVCLEDGAKLKMLKRYLRTKFDMSPEQYRAKWQLPADYPMVAPNYAATRRDLAVKIGLGRKRAEVSQSESEAAPKAAPRKRLKIALSGPAETRPALSSDTVEA